MMDGGGEYRKSPVFAGFKQFTPADAIERLVDDALYRYYHPNDPTVDPILAAANLFVDLINIHPFEDGNGRLCQMILVHVLMRSGYNLFPAILSSFRRRGRRHYIRAVKMFDRKPSLLYTMIVTSLIYCWDNIEQNTRMLAQC